MWTLGDTVSVGSEVTAPELVDSRRAPVAAGPPWRQFPAQYRCSARQGFHWEHNQWLRGPVERGVQASFPRAPAQRGS